ncbi:unnamed protein product [[Candida] boidinii]|nr:unnamed protein product [[Candida] boidinii]
MDDDNVVMSNSSPSNGDNGLMMGDRMNMGTQRNGDGGGISGNRNNNRGGGNNNNNRSNSMAATSQFSQSDTRCKCITYHMAHVFMSISHYDFTTFAGAPWRMSVRPTTKTRQEISKRIKDWCRTPHAKLCVVQCYLLLFEMFLSPQDSSYELDYTYNPDQDLFFRSNVIGLCTLVLWCFNYCTYGKERDDVVDHHSAETGNADQTEHVNIVKTEDLGVFPLLDENNNINSDSNIKENTDKIAGSNSNLIPPAEDGEGEGEAAEAEDSTSEKRGKDEGIESGYEYLRRIRKQFTDLTGGVMLHTWYETVSGSDFYMRLMKYVQVVELIKDQKNMVGLCNMIGKMMIETNYSLSKEIAKLILFCASRSNGNTETVLENMYDE